MESIIQDIAFKKQKLEKKARPGKYYCCYLGGHLFKNCPILKIGEQPRPFGYILGPFNSVAAIVKVIMEGSV